MITLKRLAIHASLSEETTAFSATVCFHGIQLGYASCRGHGDGAFLAPATECPRLFREALEWAKTQPDRVGRSIARSTKWNPKGAAGRDLNPRHDSIESFVEELVALEVEARAVRRTYRRFARAKKIYVFRMLENGESQEISFTGSERAARSKIADNYPGAVILSDLGEDEAVLAVQRMLYPSEDV